MASAGLFTWGPSRRKVYRNSEDAGSPLSHHRGLHSRGGRYKAYKWNTNRVQPSGGTCRSPTCWSGCPRHLPKAEPITDYMEKNYEATKESKWWWSRRSKSCERTLQQDRGKSKATLRRSKKKKEKYYLYHDKSSHTIDQCCNMQQLGQAQSAPPNSWGGEEDIKPTEGNRPMHGKVMVEGQRRLIQVITNCSHRRGKKRHHRVVNHIASNLKTKAAILKNCDHLQPWRCEGYPFSLSRPSHYIRKN